MMRRRVGDVFCRGVFSVGEDMPVTEALRVMRAHNISSVVVCQDGQPKGIFTERDVVRCISHGGLSFVDQGLGQVMSRNVLSITPEAYLFDAFHCLTENNIRHLVVVDNAGRAVGMITQSDMIAHLGYEYFIKVKTVDQIMTREVLTVPVGASLKQASQLMAAQAVSFLVVAEQGQPVGVLTERDLARLALHGLDLDQAQVGRHMSSPVITVSPETTAPMVTDIMRAKGVRRVVVIGAAGQVVGVATQTDMVQGMESKYIESLKDIIKEQGREINRAIRELSDKTMYLDTILRSSIDMGIVATDADLRLVYFNHAAEELMGLRENQAVGRNLMDVHADLGVEPARLEAAMCLVRAGQDRVFTFHPPGNGSRRQIQARVSGISGKQGYSGLLLMLQDITDRLKSEEIIRRLAYYDTLTGLPNRTLFNDRFCRDLARAERSGQALALIIMDVDRFKEINDTLGHAAGDEVLRGVAHRLEDLLRKVDTLARVGGDEFVFILPEVDGLAAAKLVAQKVLARLTPPFELEGLLVPLSFSLGIALYPQDGADRESLSRAADKAMYQAKDLGRQSLKSQIRAYGDMQIEG